MSETHLSKFCSVELVGERIKLPIEMHKTYCGKSVSPSEIDNENPTCDKCMDWLSWNEIDEIKE